VLARPHLQLRRSSPETHSGLRLSGNKTVGLSAGTILGYILYTLFETPVFIDAYKDKISENPFSVKCSFFKISFITSHHNKKSRRFLLIKG
jgi:hypothetical protein